MKRILFIFTLIMALSLSAVAQNITIKYVQEGAAVHAYATSDDTLQKAWDHFLSSDEAALLTSDPSVLDAKLTVMAQQQFTVIAPAPVAPPPPVNLRTTVKADPAAAATTVATFTAQRQQIVDGITALNASIPKLSTLPIATQLSILSKVQSLINSVLPK